MSADGPARFLLIESDPLVLAGRSFGPEVLGHTVMLVGWMALGHVAADDDQKRKACCLGVRKWRRLRDDILACTDKLIECSEPRARFGRPTLSKARRDAILQRDGAKCRYCRSTSGPFHIDHIKPLARGGSNRDENLCVACAPCNFAKAAKLGSEWNY